MKKKVILIVLGLCITMLAGGCSTKKNLIGGTKAITTPSPTGGAKAITSTSPTGGAAATVTPVVNDVVKEKYNVDDFVKLGKYKGVEVTAVTEDELNLAIQKEMKSYSGALKEVTDRVVKKGDTVNIDFQGMLDNKAFEGGTAAGYDLLIGSNSFIPGFEDQIVGAKKGDKLDVNVTFPENYGKAELNGKAVVFKVTVNKIQEYDLADATVKSLTGYETGAAYKESINTYLKQIKVYDAVLSGSEIKSVPQNLIDYYVSIKKAQFTNYAAKNKVDLSTFLQAMGYTEETFNTSLKDYADTMAKQDLILNAIIKAENMSLTDDEYKAKITEYATQSGYKTNEEFLKEADESILKEEILFQKALDFITKSAVVK